MSYDTIAIPLINEYNMMYNELHNMNPYYAHLTLRKNRKGKDIICKTIDTHIVYTIDDLINMIVEIKKDLEYHRNYAIRMRDITNKILECIGEDDYQFFMDGVRRD